MTRKLKQKSDPELYKRCDKYNDALARLRVMQADAEEPENRYYCRCYNAAMIEGETREERHASLSKCLLSVFNTVHGRVYAPDDKTVLPINPKGLIGLELIYRTMKNVDCSLKPHPESKMLDKLQDGYVRWEPDGCPRNVEYLQRLERQVSNEMRKLHLRKDRGYHMSAPLCEGCPEDGNMRKKLQSWVTYVEQFQDCVQSYQDGEIDWPKNAPELFQITPRQDSENVTGNPE